MVLPSSREKEERTALHSLFYTANVVVRPSNLLPTSRSSLTIHFQWSFFTMNKPEINFVNKKPSPPPAYIKQHLIETPALADARNEYLITYSSALASLEIHQAHSNAHDRDNVSFVKQPVQ